MVTMKKYIPLITACLFILSCSQREDSVYGEGNSYVNRTGETLTTYSKILEETHNNWLLTLYAGNNQQYGGHNFLVSFKNGKVKAISEINTTEATSDYSMSFNEKAILSFDTYNEVLHYFVNPSFLFPQGKVGDNQFEIQSYKDGVFTLKGKRSYNTMTLEPFEGDKNTFLTKIQERANHIKTIGITPITIDGKQINLTLHPTLHQMTISSGNTSIKKAFVYTDKGLKLYEPVSIEGTTFSEFYISDDYQQLSTPDGSIKTSLSYTLPYDFLSKNLMINLSSDGCQNANTEAYRLFNQYRNFTYLNVKYYTKPLVKLGTQNGKTGLSFSIYQNASTTFYSLDFLAVPGKPNQVNIAEGIRGEEWNLYSTLFPIVELFIQNAPYELTDVNNDGSQYKLTSVKNNEITFLTTPEGLTLPYDMTTKRITIEFVQNSVSQDILTAYNKVKTRTSGSGSNKVVDALSSSMYFGKNTRNNRDNIGLHFFVSRTTNGKTTQYPVAYSVDFLPTICNANQINMIEQGVTSLDDEKNVANRNWQYFSYLAPLANVLINNAPYSIIDYGNGYRAWVSVPNPDTWFYTKE